MGYGAAARVAGAHHRAGAIRRERPLSISTPDTIDESPKGSVWVWSGLAVAGTLALVPVFRWVVLIRRSSRLQYHDYWPMLTEVLSPDGGLQVDGLFEVRNGHPIAVPKLLYWLNARVFHGSNRTLGVFVVLVALVSVVVFVDSARRTSGYRRLDVALVGVVGSALLLSPRGNWYVVKSMSGTAWVTANLMVALALAAESRGRRVLAVGLGLAASFTYGTGMAVWPALLIAGFIRDGRIWRRWPTVVGGLAVLIWYLPPYLDRPKTRWTPERTPVDRVQRAMQVLGGYVRPTDDGWTTFIGAALVIVGVIAAGVLVLDRRRRLVPQGSDQLDGADGVLVFIGMLIHTVTATVMIGGAPRLLAISDVSRYAIFGATLLLTVFGLVVAAARSSLGASVMGRARRGPQVFVGVALLMAGGLVAVGWSSSPAGRDVTHSEAMQAQMMVAFHLGLVDGSKHWQGGLEEVPVGMEELARRTRHVPFDRPLPYGCDRLLDTIGPEEVSPEELYGSVARNDAKHLVGGTLVYGFADVGEQEIECVVVVDEAGMVHGTGGFGGSAGGYSQRGFDRPGRIWFRTIAKAVPDLDVLVKLRGEPLFHPIERR